jgi:serine phosphatase RsbU (regulator of sigma subunit)
VIGDVCGTGPEAAALTSPGTLLGMLDKVRFTTQTRHLNSGDVIVFYIDGATDLAPPHDLDSAELRELVRQAVHPSATADATAEQIHEALEAILTFDRRTDDIALLVLTVADPPADPARTER